MKRKTSIVVKEEREFMGNDETIVCYAKGIMIDFGAENRGKPAAISILGF